MNIQSSEQCHLSFDASLKSLFDCCCIEINLALQKRIKCRIYGKQQLVNLGIDFNSLLDKPTTGGYVLDGTDMTVLSEQERNVH